ncbi:hypothetical protein ACFFGH_32035 [Lysobacter korlensis]|uniref:Lipoprotein n=1 Tax=Lysobacter korlensis TaxID=553636 RepID=A0ABV6RZS2_9GAMM
MTQWLVRAAGAMAVPLIAGVALTGCSSAPSVLSTSDGGLIVVSGQQADAHPEALAKGRLEWGTGECLNVTVPDTGGILVVFPYGTVLSADGVVGLPNGTVLRVGDEVGLGGGFYSPERTSGWERVPEACITSEIFVASGEVSD